MITDFPIVYSQNDLLQVSSCLLGLFKDKFKVKNVLIVGLTGDLGAGKTTLCKEILKQLQVSGPVVSPTFVLRKDYEGILEDQKIDIIHIDAYRLEKPEHIEQVLEISYKLSLGKDKITPNPSLGEEGSRTLILVEWAELADLQYDLHFVLKHVNDSEREINLV